MSNQGLSFIEVLIAIAVVSIGIIPVVGLQASAFKASQTATIVKELTHLAETEIASRQTDIRQNDASCSASMSGASCQVVVEACTFNATSNALTCDASISFPDAYKVTVSASHSERNISLMTVVNHD